MAVWVAGSTIRGRVMTGRQGWAASREIGPLFFPRVVKGRQQAHGKSARDRRCARCGRAVGSAGERSVVFVPGCDSDNQSATASRPVLSVSMLDSRIHPVCFFAAGIRCPESHATKSTGRFQLSARLSVSVVVTAVVGVG